MMLRPEKHCWFPKWKFEQRIRKLYKTTVKIIRSPYLYSEQYEKDFLNTVFREISAEQKITFQEDESQRMFFLSMQDLAELMYKIFDNWDEDEEILNIADGFDHCFKDLGDKLTELCPHRYVRLSIDHVQLRTSEHRSSTATYV